MHKIWTQSGFLTVGSQKDYNDGSIMPLYVADYRIGEQRIFGVFAIGANSRHVIALKLVLLEA